MVDDGSTDGTSEAVADKFPQVKIIRGDGTLYWNRGMYLAWSEAAKQDFDFYLWLNDDTFLFPLALSRLLEGARLTEGKAIICSATCSAVNGVLTYGGILKKKGIFKKKKFIEPNGQLQECDYFTGNFVLISRYIYQTAGNLDYSFVHLFGDYDYAVRAGKLGIPSFVAGYYVGTCEKHESVAQWCSPALKLKDRIKAFKTPLAVNPVDHFKFDYSYEGLFSAVLHFITIHIRLLFPSLWIRR